jgi:hypothetical protein
MLGKVLPIHIRTQIPVSSRGVGTFARSYQFHQTTCGLVFPSSLKQCCFVVAIDVQPPYGFGTCGNASHVIIKSFRYFGVTDICSVCGEITPTPADSNAICQFAVKCVLFGFAPQDLFTMRSMLSGFCSDRFVSIQILD